MANWTCLSQAGGESAPLPPLGYAPKKQPFANAINNIFLKFRNIHSEISVLESLLNKVAELQACNVIKKTTPTQVFSCEYCEVFKNSFFIEHLRWLVLQVLYKNSCSQGFCKLHENISSSGYFLIKIQAQNLQLYQNRRCFAVNFVKIPRAYNAEQRLLLNDKWCCGK